MKKHFYQILFLTVISITVLFLIIRAVSGFTEPDLSNSGKDYKRIAYTISNTETMLGSTLGDNPVQYFGNETSYDFNRDGKEDKAFLVVQTGVGSSTLFYLVTALSDEKKYHGSIGAFIGDSIAPQTTTVSENGVVTVNYAKRGPGESLKIQPSIAESASFTFDVDTKKFTRIQ